MGKLVGIYKITSPSNRIYIGQSINIKKRLASYRAGRCKTQTLLYHSILKHGYEVHTVEVIRECDRDELDFWERYYIIKYDTFNTPHGMNLCSGGGASRVISDETRRKMSESMSGDKNPFYGKRHSKETLTKLRGVPKSEETKRKIIAAKQNIRNETRLKMSISQRRKAAPSEIARARMSKSQKGRKHSLITKEKISAGNSKKVIQTDVNGKVVMEYKSITEASIITGIKRTTISGCVNGYCQSAGGFKWKKIQK